MASREEEDLPLALRRSRRRSLGPRGPSSAASSSSSPNAPCKNTTTDLTIPLPSCLSSATTINATPRKEDRQAQKRVRFSDPGVRLGSPSLDDDNDDNGSSTGLTPMIRRTAIAGAAGRPKRRYSTPGRPPRSTPRDSRSFTDLHSPKTPFSGEVSFLPLRQVLDGRVKRRIRRNGLSEEMNAIAADRKRRAREARAELDSLRASLAEKDYEIRRLQEETASTTTTTMDLDAVSRLEREVDALRQELADRSASGNIGGSSGSPGVPGSPSCDWTLAARDPFSDDFMDMDVVDARDGANDDDGFGDGDGEFGQSTIAEITCSTPVRRGSGTFLTPPESSTATTPTTPRFDTGVQACLPDPDKQQLEDELATLQLETSKLTSTLESYAALASRLSGKLRSFPPDDGATADVEYTTPDATAGRDGEVAAPPADLEARLGRLLQTLSDRTTALVGLNSSLSDLGFPGTDASEMVGSLSEAFRAARLELEYLTPGEVSLPLSAAGAMVLDLVLARLRELGRRGREADATIDEYHALELSLRQQLEARVAATDGLARERDGLTASLAERDARIGELEVGLDRLKGATQSYARDVAELETLVRRVESDLAASETARDDERRERAKEQAKHAEENTKHAEQTAEQAERAERAGREAAERAEKTAEKTAADLAARDRDSAELRERLAAATESTAQLAAQLEALRAAHGEALEEVRATHRAEMSALRGEHGRALAARDGRVAELRDELERVGAALRAAHETIRQLRVEGDRLRADNADLAAEAEGDHQRARGAIASMRSELERVVRMSDGLLATPTKPRRAAWLVQQQRDEKVMDMNTCKNINGKRSSPHSHYHGDNDDDDDNDDARRDDALGDAEGADDVILVGTPTPTGARERFQFSAAVVKSEEGHGERGLGLKEAKAKASKRRRYDSGLGFLEEEEEEFQDALDGF